MKLIKRIEELTPEFTAIRRDFHKYPEVGHQENVTAEKLPIIFVNGVIRFIRKLPVPVS